MYNSRQIQCMEAIGLVPWVRRTADAQILAEQADASLQPASSPVNSLSPTAGIPITAKEQSDDQAVVVSGDTKSALLLIFDLQDGGAWPLNKEDDALLEGMLRAIGMSKALVCSCAILQDAPVLSAERPSASLQSLCQSPRKRFMYFGGDAIAADTVDPIPMSQAATDSALDGWRLPTLAKLREEPLRKRHAWVTLKKLRSSLDHN